MEKECNVKKIAVVGGGVMGAGIIYTISHHGFAVCFKELNDELAKKCQEQVNRIYQSALKKGKTTEGEVKRALSLIQGGSDYKGFDEVDLVIEAVPEKVDIKRNVFQEIDRVCKPEAIFASNTSALPISELASFTKRKSKFIGMHWFNPPHVMKLIEVVPGLETSEETVKTLMTFCERLKKVPIQLKECAGFLVARLLGIYVNEAFWMLGERYQPEEIDQAGIDLGMPMGPFTLGDMAGWDVVYHANTTLYESYGPRFTIPPLFHKLFNSGKLGVKTGQGIYSYQKVESGPPKKTGEGSSSLGKEGREILANRFLWTMINEGIRCLDEGIAHEGDIDQALELGAGMPKGPLAWADEVGLDGIFRALDYWKDEIGERYWPSPLLRRKVKAGHLGRKVGRGFYNYQAKYE